MGVVARILEKKLKSTGEKIQGFFGKPAAPAWPERKYPLNLRPNAVVRFDPTLFLLAEGLLRIPSPDGDWSVVAIGEFSMAGFGYYRFYLTNLQEEELILQVDKNLEKPEIVVFKTIDELFPSPGGPTTWENWLDEEYGWIGCIDFHLPDGTEYYRIIQNPGPARISPLGFRETLFTENETSFIEHTAMIYGREISVEGMDTIVENLMISQESDDEGALVSVNVGLSLLPSSLTIL